MGRNSVLKHHEFEATRLVEQLMTERFGSQALTAEELGNFPDSIAAWLTHLQVGARKHQVFLALKRHFPYSRPVILVPADSELIGRPHVGTDRSLCLEPGHVSFAHRRPADIVEYMLNRAEQCLSLSEAQARAELIEEFQAYWDQRAGTSYQALTMVRPEGPSRSIHLYRGKDALLFADSRDDALRWIANLTGSEDKTVRRSTLIWLDHPLIPREFPRTNRELAELVRRQSGTTLQLLHDVLNSDGTDVSVLLGFDSENGPALGALTLSAPWAGQIKNGKIRQKKLVMNGFRPGKITRSVLANRFLHDFPLQLNITRRADPEWLYFRGGHAARSANKSNKHAVIIGCGALGSAVAFGLAKCGIGRLTLIDGDRLTMDNVARHMLGASNVGPTKETAVKIALLSHLPHMKIETYPGRRWQDVYSEEPGRILDSDLVVSTTGSWESDDPLNLVIKTSANPPAAIFGWMEPFGCAGHALCVMRKGGCLACGMDECGNFSKRCTVWDQDTMIRAGACGEFFQPFSHLEAMQTQAMILRLCLDALEMRVHSSLLRTWVGSTRYLLECGGSLSESIEQSMNDSEGGLYTELSWDASGDCLLCNT